MPPSGYSASQSSYMVEFLASCSCALEEEGLSKSWTPTQALENECAGIERALAEGCSSPFAEHVLELTKSFYAEILNRRPKDFGELRHHATDVLGEVSRAILEVHVPSLESSEVVSR